VTLEIPLFTDVEVSETQFGNHLLGTLAVDRGSDAWVFKTQCLDLIQARGGFANHHGHFDKAFLINSENLVLSQSDMQKKWYRLPLPQGELQLRRSVSPHFKVRGRLDQAGMPLHPDAGGCR